MHPTASLLSAGVVAGMVAGLAAAFFTALSYLISRHHANRVGGDSLRLLTLAHVLMGLVCLPLAWWLRPGSLPDAADWLPPLLGSTLTYVAGQACVFAALKGLPASRLAPLMGLKIGMLAAIVSCLPGRRLGAIQWLAVLASMAAAALLRRGGGGGPARAVAAVLGACFVFAVSDLCSVFLIQALEAGGAGWWERHERLHAGCFAMAVTYSICAAGAAVILPWWWPRDRRDWDGAWQYAAAWLVSVTALYVSFAVLGVVFTNILQSTRGIIAVVLGALLAHLGWHDLEDRVDRATLLRRLAAAMVMTGAIALFMLHPA